MPKCLIIGADKRFRYEHLVGGIAEVFYTKTMFGDETYQLEESSPINKELVPDSEKDSLVEGTLYLRPDHVMLLKEDNSVTNKEAVCLLSNEYGVKMGDKWKLELEDTTLNQRTEEIDW